MPTLGTHLSDELADTVEGIAKTSPEKKVGPWIAEAIRQRLEREGKLPGDPAAEVVAAAEEIGFARAAEILRAAKAMPILAGTKKARERVHRSLQRKLKEAA